MDYFNTVLYNLKNVHVKKDDSPHLVKKIKLFSAEEKSTLYTPFSGGFEDKG